MRVERKKNGETNGAQTNGAQTNGAHGASTQAAAPDEARPVYYISVVAEMVETHPQTLRMYERVGLVCPCRTRAGVRLYSQADVEQVRRIQHLTQELGVNLAGVEVIFDLLREMQHLQEEMENIASQPSTRAPKSTR